MLRGLLPLSRSRLRGGRLRDNRDLVSPFRSAEPFDPLADVLAVRISGGNYGPEILWQDWNRELPLFAALLCHGDGIFERRLEVHLSSL